MDALPQLFAIAALLAKPQQPPLSPPSIRELRTAVQQQHKADNTRKPKHTKSDHSKQKQHHTK